MKIMEVHLITTEDGPALEFLWYDDARQKIEQWRIAQIVGDAIATFGEQMRVHAEVKAAREPGRIVGPDGNWIA
jgi:hypothetical protein